MTKTIEAIASNVLDNGLSDSRIFKCIQGSMNLTYQSFLFHRSNFRFTGETGFVAKQNVNNFNFFTLI